MTKLTKKQNEIISLIKVIRESFADAKTIYNYGACYAFYKILKEVYPEASAYGIEEGGHILTKIGKEYYDIVGITPEKPSKKPLTEKEHAWWDANVCGIRAEEMIRRKIKNNR